MGSSMKLFEHILETLSAGGELNIYKGNGTGDANNIYLNLEPAVSFTNLVLRTSQEIFITAINECELEDPIPVDEEAANQTGGFSLNLSKTKNPSFQSIKLLGGSNDAAVSIFVC